VTPAEDVSIIGPRSTYQLTEVKCQTGTSVLARFAATLDPVGNRTRIDLPGSPVQTQGYANDASGEAASVDSSRGQPSAG